MKPSPSRAPDESRSDVFTAGNTKYRLTLKKTVRGFYRAYAEVKFPTHMELVDFSEVMPELWGPKRKVMTVRSGSTFANNPAALAHQYLDGLIEAREAQIEKLNSWGSKKVFTEEDQRSINMLQQAIKKSKEDKRNDAKTGNK